MQRSPSPGRRLARWAPALAVAATAGLAGCSSSPTASSTTTSSSALTTTTTTDVRSTTSNPPTTTTFMSREQLIARAWLAEVNAFYTASERDDPSFGPLLSSWVMGGPVADHAEAYLLAQEASGVVGPSTWRIGNARVVSVDGDTAHVEGCSYDPGSHYKATGAVAPADLGGGAGLTGYSTTMLLQAGRWLVDATVVTAPATAAEAGPCHGF